MTLKGLTIKLNLLLNTESIYLLMVQPTSST
jgi:hypothetical protein